MSEGLGHSNDDSFDYAERVVHEIMMDSIVKPGMEASIEDIKMSVDSEVVLRQLLSNVRIVGDPTQN